MTQADLFNEPVYPETPGHRHTATSREAARSVKDRAPTLRDQVLALIKTEPLTADEAAAKLNTSILSIRPRVTELKRMGQIYDSGITRKNISGVSASVWRAT